jgi:hypothetical protein
MSSDFAGTIGRINLAGTSAGLLGTHGATKSKTYASTGVPLHVRIALLRIIMPSTGFRACLEL